MIYNTMSVMRDQAGAAAPAAPRPPKGPARAPRGRASDSPEPFDPNELARRLDRVLADQDAAAAAKSTPPRPAEPPAGGPKPRSSRLSKLAGRRGAPSAPAPAPADAPPARSRTGAGHAAYVPKQAAAQFARTTTAVGMRGAHPHGPAQPALRLRVHGGERAPPQRMAALQGAAEAEARERDRRRRQLERERRTFAGEVEQLLGPGHAGPAARGEPSPPRGRTSLGDAVAAEAEGRASSSGAASEELEGADEAGALEPLEHARVDWTQSDELAAAAHAHAHGRPPRAPLLRRADSLWALRGRLGGMSRHGPPRADEREGPAAPGGRDPTSPLKSPKSGFFSRFRR